LKPLKPTAISGTEPRPWTPHDYQVKAMRWLLSHAGAGLFLDPGLGKTSINLGAIKVLLQEGELPNGALVCCQLRPLYNVWDSRNPESEPAKWTDFHGIRFEMLHGPGKDEALRRKANVYLINPEGLDWYFSKIKTERLPQLFDLDESTTFKHTNTTRFGLLRGWLPRFRRRWINTGTPSPNGLLDLFGQVYILDMGNALGAYITHYRRRYFQPTGYGGHTWILKGLDSSGNDTAESEQTKREIYERLDPLILRMDEKDYLKLPKLHGALAHSKGEPALVRVTLPKKAKDRIAELEELFFTQMEEGVVTAVNAGVKHMKLRQAANGGIYFDDNAGDEDLTPRAKRGGPRKWAHLHDAKSEAVVELLEGGLGNGQVVISVEFHHDVERLRMQKILRNVPAIGEKAGAAGLKEDAALARDWNGGRLKILMVNPASFSRGSNMQRGGDALIFHSMIWNFEHYDQLIRRFWRQGRTRPFYVKHIVAEGTSDVAMVRALQGKNSTQRGLLDALRAYSRQKRIE
jgi:SNF2 family DNA or RNA helicase